MNTRILSVAVMLLVVALSAPALAVNILTDPGFETNPLNTASNVLNNFSLYQGEWGVEMASITGPDGGVTPFQGSNMLKMTDDGLVTTQGFQMIDVSSYTPLISTGTATVNLTAMFNPDRDLPAAVGGVYVSFFNSNTYGSITTTIGNVLTLDNSFSTWEPISVSGAIPVGTTWIGAQVAYSNASLNLNDGAVHAGYVDAADLSIVPEPGTLLLLLTAVTGLALFTWRKR